MQWFEYNNRTGAAHADLPRRVFRDSARRGRRISRRLIQESANQEESARKTVTVTCAKILSWESTVRGERAARGRAAALCRSPLRSRLRLRGRYHSGIRADCLGKHERNARPQHHWAQSISMGPAAVRIDNRTLFTTRNWMEVRGLKPDTSILTRSSSTTAASAAAKFEPIR